MELYFLRHGLAGQHGDPKYKDDSLRPLTGEGREKMRREAQGMRTLGLKFDAILSSPYLRATQTAEIVAAAYKIKSKKIHLTNNLLPPATAGKLLAEIRRRFPQANALLLAGHEPHLSQLVSSLLKSNKTLPLDFKKGGLCRISLEEKARGRLAWLLSPEQLEALS